MGLEQALLRQVPTPPPGACLTSRPAPAL